MKSIIQQSRSAKLLALVFSLIVTVALNAQVNIIKAEYFIDTDPGFGLAVNIPVTAAPNIADKAVNISLLPVGDGFHNLFLRSKDANGNWSITNKVAFFKTSGIGTPLSNVTKAEYFIDTDPGFGLAVDIPVASSTNISDKSITIPLGPIAEGFHNLFLRTRDANGNWSITNKQAFFKTNGTAANIPNLVKAEYFIDTDPGFGLGVNIPVSSSTNVIDKSIVIPLASVPEGFHNLFLRVKDANGNWSVTNTLAFYKTNSTAANLPNVIKAEYFIDTDPGFGSATNIPVTSSTNIADKSVVIPLGTVTEGFHNLFVRSKDANGNWSISNKLAFYKTNSTLATLPNIVKAEYFIDTDPGFGSANDIPITAATNIADKSTVIALNAVTEGFHNLFIRSKDANGTWSISNKLAFYKTKAAGTPASNIIAAEYFIDTDPGFGNGSTISVTPSTNISNRIFDVDLTGVTAGSHRFYLRSKNAEGAWSITNTDTFFISSVVIPSVTIGNVQTIICAGDTVFVPFTVSTPFTAGNKFTAQLSNAAGDFGSPVDIGSLTTTNSGTIITVVPAGTATGTAYRIRIVSTSPINTSKSVDQLTVRRKPTNDFNINGPATTCVGAQNYSVSVPEAGASYAWKVSEGGTVTPSGSSASINWTVAGSHTITVTASNSCGSGSVKTLVVQVFAAAPAFTPTISIVNRTLTAAAAGLAQGVTGYQWYKDGVEIAGQINQSYTVPDLETGSYTVAYVNGCGTGNQSAPTVINVVKNNQTVSFTPVSAKTYGDAAFDVQATATSGLPITNYSIVSGPGTIAGNTVTITGAGIIVVKAFQAGSNTFNEAEAILNITVNKAAASVVLSSLSHSYDGTAKKAIATTTPLGLNTIITYNGSVELPVTAGSYAVTATITSENYQGSANGTLVIGKASQTITLVPISDKSFNDAPFTVFASASSGLPVTLSIVTVPAAGVASINGNIITMLGTGGTVTVTATQAGNQNYNAATQASTSFTVKPPTANDVQVVSLLNPVGGCSLGSQSDITVRIKNAGTAPASGITVSYYIENGITVTESIPGSLASGAELDHTFTGKGNFPTAGKNYAITAYTVFAADEKTSNDTLVTTVTRFAIIPSGVSNDTAICLGSSAELKAFGGGSYKWTDGPTTATRTVNPASMTTYEVAVTDPNGCTTAKHSVTVTVNAVPTASAGNDTSMLKGSSITLKATGGGSYKWSNGDTTAETVVSPTVTTTYTVTVTNQFGCTATDNVLVTVNFSAITVAPGAYNFGSVVVDSSAFKDIVITNTGTLSETINELAGADNSDPFFINFVTPVTLPAGTSINIPVRFTPDATLFYLKKLTLTTSAGTFNLTLQGKGVAPAPAWTIVPASYNFGNVEIGTTQPHDFLISNKGNIPISLTTVSSSSVRFSGLLVGPSIIPVGGSGTLKVSFSPVSIAASAGTITVRTSTTGLASAKVLVSGNGYVDGAPPQLLFVDNSPFNGETGVTPAVGKPGTYTYSIVYRHPDGTAPMTDFPRVGIDKNGDKDFVDDGEGIFNMNKEGSTTDWVNGETFSFNTDLGISELYGYQFFATDSLGNSALNSNYIKGPLVTREILDLHIFADDIVFSKKNPAVNEDFTVTATIHNNSPYAASSVPIQFFYKDSLFLFYDTIPFIDGNSSFSITRTLNFSPDGFYPIKVWIDSSNTLGEGNLLNNYASRPVIVGHFTVPGTIDVVSTATPSGCSKGKIAFSGKANYRGLNLVGTPPVEGATVTITIPNYEQGRVLTTHTDINGQWYVYDDPCSQDVNPQDCSGYICGVKYDYTVEVTDYTLTSPVFNSSVTRPCVQCKKIGRIQHGATIENCILDNHASVYGIGVANFEYDFVTGEKLCAPTVYKDTFDVFLDGVHMFQHTLDSIASCGTASFQDPIPGLAPGQHVLSYTHVYYNGLNERQETDVASSFTVHPLVSELDARNFGRTGRTSFSFLDYNESCYTAGSHKVYVYDSLPGYTEMILIDSFFVSGVGPNSGVGLGYNNPDWEVGCHHITIVVDVANTVPEGNENNNVLKGIVCVEPVFPDIEITGLQISTSSVKAGQKVNFTAKIKNIGSGPVLDPFKVQFKVGEASLGVKINVASLAVDESTLIVSDPFTIPINSCPFEIKVRADVDEAIVETEEVKNNRDSMIFGVNIKAGRSCGGIFSLEETIGAAAANTDSVTYCIPFTNTCFKIPDAAAELDNVFCQPYKVLRNVLTRFETNVRNNGTRDIENVKVKFTWNGQVIGTDVIPLLKAGELRQDIGFSFAFDTIGNFVVNAFADYDHEICEISETDNVGQIHISTIRNVADLLIYSQHIAPSNLNPLPGQPITIAASALNVSRMPSTPCKIRFWVNDEQLGDDIPIDSLYPGQDTTVLATVPYVSNIVGLKIIKVRVDIEAQVLESNRGNNEATRSIIVGAAPDFSHSLHEALTISPQDFSIGDSVVISNYLRNYGGDGGTAWLKFWVRNKFGELIVLDSVKFTLASNDSGLVSLKWKVNEAVGMIITEILHAAPPEFNDQNNIDSLFFQAVLPLKLISFTGKLQGNDAVLNWKTVSEYNVSRFEVERSGDGSNFAIIGQRPAYNSSAEQLYGFTDVAAFANGSTNWYYRLKMIDKDGKFSYSDIVLLTASGPLITHVYPNPVHSNLFVELKGAKRGSYTVKLTDGAGRECMERKFDLTQGNHLINIPVTSLASGMYLVKICGTDGETISVDKLMKN